MSEGLRIRPGEPGDRDAIARLQIASWRSAYRGILSDAFLDGPIEEERGTLWARRLAPPVDPDMVLVLAEEGRDAVGFACILAADDPAWGSLVDNLHVRPDRKRLRLGAGLLREAALRVPAVHAGTPVHLTVFEANRAAIGAYERWGGRLVERLDHLEPDGRLHPLRRYLWDDPAELARRVAAAG